MSKRWPTLLGLVGAGLGMFAAFTIDSQVGFAPGVACMALIYMLTFAWGRPATVWIAFPISSAVLLAFEAIGDHGWAVTGLLVALVLTWLVAILRGRVKQDTWFTIETLGMVGFGAIALVAVLVEVRAGGVLAGLGFLAHGVWDAWHFIRNRVVARSFSEFCGVVDIILAIAIPVAALAA